MISPQSIPDKKKVIELINKEGFINIIQDYVVEDFRFEYVDLNNDGTNEIFVTSISSGNHWSAWWVISVRPLKLLYSCDGCPGTYPFKLPQKHKGYFDIKNGNEVLKWNGKEYE